MTPTKAEELAARLESGWCPIESPADMERAAAELRRLAAVEAERDDLKLAFAHTVRLVQDWKQSAYAMEAERDAMRLDYSRLLEKHNNLHANAARDRAERDALQRKVQETALQALADDTQHREVEAERDALLEMLKEARQMVFEWGSNAQDLFDLLPQDLARIDAAIDAAMKGTK